MKIILASLLAALAVLIIPAASECGNKPADLLFLLDASSSIWAPNFRKQLAFVRQVVEQFDISPTHTRCGVLTFGDYVQEEFGLTRFLSKTPLIRDGIGRIVQLRGTTRTDLAVQRMREIFKRDPRPDVPKIAVVLTDGQSNHPNTTAAQAALAHEEGVTLFAIGVGRDVQASELQALASQPEFALSVENHDALQSIRDFLLTQTCTLKTAATVDPEVCGNKPADIVFTLDASGSIWAPDFQTQLRFVQHMVDRFDISPELTRVGVITFGDQPHREFHLDRYSTASTLRAAIGNIRQVRGSTNTAEALHRLRTHYFADHGRSGVVQIAIVITDGRSNNPLATARQAALARALGVHVFAVGVGSQVLQDELEAIASRPGADYIFRVEDFPSLSTIEALLARRTCEVAELLTTTEGLLSSTDSFSTAVPTAAPPSAVVIVEKSPPVKVVEPPRGLMLGDSTPCTFPADVVFALPSDADTSRTNHGLGFIRAVSSRLDVSEDGVHIGVLPKNCYSLSGFPLSQGYGRERVQRLLDTHHYTAPQTVEQVKALRDQAFRSENGGRPNAAAKIGVLVVDKDSLDRDELRLETEMAELEGIELFVVGVGPDVSEQELRTMATSDNHWYHVNEYCDLLSLADHMVKKIDSVCATL